MTPILTPLKLPEEKETEIMRERRTFHQHYLAAKAAQRQKRADAVKALFRSIFRKQKGRGNTAPSLQLSKKA